GEEGWLCGGGGVKEGGVAPRPGRERRAVGREGEAAGAVRQREPPGPLPGLGGGRDALSKYLGQFGRRPEVSPGVPDIDRPVGPAGKEQAGLQKVQGRGP